MTTKKEEIERPPFLFDDKLKKAADDCKEVLEREEIVSKKNILKELKSFEMILPDGELKDCVVYHQAVKTFLSDALDSYFAYGIEEILKECEEYNISCHSELIGEPLIKKNDIIQNAKSKFNIEVK